MEYKNIITGTFIDRPNRFTAHVEIDGKTEICHVVNTGRMKELLIKGTKVYLSVSDNPLRKTAYDLIAVEHDGNIVNIDSFAPNKVAYEYVYKLFPDIKFLRPETSYGNSRFDIYAETENDRIFLEVKGVTLNVNGQARFPDAPTERGTKHLNELIKAKNDGYVAGILFVIAMKGVTSFSANRETDPIFYDALIHARQNGVMIFAVDCTVSENGITADKAIKVCL